MYLERDEWTLSQTLFESQLESDRVDVMVPRWYMTGKSYNGDSTPFHDEAVKSLSTYMLFIDEYLANVIINVKQ